MSMNMNIQYNGNSSKSYQDILLKIQTSICWWHKNKSLRIIRVNRSFDPERIVLIKRGSKMK